MSYESNNQRKFREENEVDTKTFAYTLAFCAGLVLGTYMLHGYLKNPKVFDSDDRSYTNRLHNIEVKTR